MNQEQVKSVIRSLLSTFGGIIVGFFVSKGWFSADQVLSVITSETFIGIITSGAVLVWGLFVHKQSNAVAIVAAIAAQPESPVKGVVTEPTIEGRALASSIPGPKIATAGTAAATAISKS